MSAPDSPLEWWRTRLAELEAIPAPTFADGLATQTARVVVADLALWEDDDAEA